MHEPTTRKVKSRDGIDWYCESRGSGPDVVLIPAGEGDCESFSKVAPVLANSFTVTTFDMPGMSRTRAPQSAMESISPSKLAAQIVGLLDELSIDKATFWGCSSGGLAALTLAAEYPDRVRNVVVHEVPLAPPDSSMPPLQKMDDEAVVATCQHMFSTAFCEDAEKWKAHGPAYHDRLKKNYVTWARTYYGLAERSFSKEELTRRPVRWTIGALTPAGRFYQNVVDGYAAGIPVGLLPSMHVPQITVPEALAEHIKSAVEEHL